jgi:hypothetical protein
MDWAGEPEFRIQCREACCEEALRVLMRSWPKEFGLKGTAASKGKSFLKGFVSRNFMRQEQR